MDNKLNEHQISTYSEQVAQKLLDSFFSSKEKISGEEILNFCTIKQVNLFILKGLFQKWNSESQKLESPYFDYNHPEVIAAIDDFKNIVSRHILVNQLSFRPILIKSIADTLTLICSPYHFYLNELNAMNHHGFSSLEGLKEIKKFTKVNVAILDGLINNLDQSTKNKPEASEILDNVIENLTSGPDEMDSYIEAFSDYVPLNINDIYTEIETPHIDQEPAHLDLDTSEETPGNFDLSEEPTLNDTLGVENQMSIADMHEQQKIESLSKGIMLNQRFMFVNVLFDGDVAKFNNAVVEIDELLDLTEAKNYISKRLGHWVIENVRSQ